MSHVYTILAVVGVIFGLVLMTGLLAGQFRRGVVDELRAALASAQTEIAISSGIVTRLSESIQRLEARIVLLENENRILRDAINSGDHLKPVLKSELDAAANAAIGRYSDLAAELPGVVRTALLSALDERASLTK